MSDDDARRAATDPRVLFAAERTFLAWLRTGIALMGFGFVVARFSAFLRELAIIGNQPEPSRLGGPTIGLIVVASGVVVNAWATIRHQALVQRLRRGETEIPMASPLAVGAMTAIGGIILVALLLGTSGK